MSAISVSHLIDVTAYQPGTTRRREIHAGPIALRRSSRMPATLRRDSGHQHGGCVQSESGPRAPSTAPRSAPRNSTSRARFRTPARASTSRTGTPVHSAVLTAPRYHCSPWAGGSNDARPFPAHSSVTICDCDRMPWSSRKLKLQFPSHQAADAKSIGLWIESRHVKVIAKIEARVRHDDAADQRRNRRLAIQRMRAVNHEPAFNRVLAGILRIERRDLADRYRRTAAAAGGDGCTGRCRKNIYAAGLFERR